MLPTDVIHTLLPWIDGATVVAIATGTAKTSEWLGEIRGQHGQHTYPPATEPACRIIAEPSHLPSRAQPALALNSESLSLARKRFR
jgi:hypothetical protein